MKRLFAIITGLAVAAVLIVPSPAAALTADELQLQIDQLLNQLSALQDQLADLTGGTGGTVTGCTITSFDRNLSVTMTGADVKCLQIVLNSSSDTKVASTGAGSPGNETTYFGPLTKSAVIEFQEKYASTILTPLGLTAGTGYVGSATRVKLNALLAAGEEEEEEEEEGPAGSLTVTLASDTPDAATVAAGANANFTKIRLKASSEGDVNISKIYITRSGLTANADVENIKIIDVATGQYVGDIGSLNTNNEASISFVPKLEIESGETREFYIRAGIDSAATAGKTAILGIASADDIISDADSVSGSFPIKGEAMTVVSLTIGSVTISEVTLTDSQPNVGDTDVDVLEFKLAAGSTEDVVVETVTVKEAGTADTSDSENVELYDVTNGKSLGTVANWSTDEKATWDDLNITIAKGKSLRLRVRVDVVSGVSSSTKTINADVVDSSDTTVVVKGTTYGFYITPTRSPTTWDGKGTDQTIQAGALTVTRSSSTPATGNIAPGDDIPLAVFDFEAEGEEVKITAITIALTIGGGAVASDVTNVKLFDEDGVIVAGPANPDSSEEVAYTDTFIVPVGVHQYTVKATIADSADAGNTILAGVKNPGTTTTLTATGMTSGDSIQATPTNTVNANTLTVASGALTVTTLADPASRSVPSPTNDFVWATFSFDASTSGEDINVTDITITDSYGEGNAAVTDMDNAELWADLTSANSSRGDVYDTKISSTEQWAAATRAFVLTQTLVIPAGSFKKVAMVADLASGATGVHTFYITSSGVTATGAVTAETITAGYASTSMQRMSVGTSTLTVTKDASSPASGIVIGNTDKVTLGVFKLAASNVQDLDLDAITLSASNGTFVDTFYFYSGATLLQGMSGANSVYVPFSDGTLTIPANSSKLITVKADLLPVDGTTVTNDGEIMLTLTGASNVETTGLGSGSAVDSSETISANRMYIYKSRPYFALNSSSPSGNLNPSSNTNVAIFDVTADAGEDVTFESGDSSVIKIQLDATVHDTATNYVTLTLKDEDGQIVGVDSVNIGVAGVNDGTTFTFDNTNSFGGTSGVDTTYSWRIAAGQTEKLYGYLNTTNFEDDGDFVQIWLNDSAAGNLVFGIDGSGTYSEGLYIFKGDIYAGSFVNPS